MEESDVMKEIEILVEVYNEKQEVLKKLNKFEYVGSKETLDIYYYDPKRSNLKPDSNNQINECLRLRSSNKKYSITYKVDKFDNNGKWLYSDEYETNIDDIEILEKILENLGLKELLRVHNIKEEYVFNEYNIVFEDVTDLGYFLEVEYCTKGDIDVKKKKLEIDEFIKTLELDVSEELNMGKPEMIIRKNNICVGDRDDI